jgi:putative peptide zinc metalloprotease protein
MVLRPTDNPERRKRVRVRLRRNLVVTPQQQGGRPCYVVKDPVSLRYSHLDDRQHTVTGLMDGTRTLEEIRTEYERRFRPDRLPPEELEAFVAQLVRDGLAESDSPQAADVLLASADQHRKQARWSALLNVLAIRIPLCSPDRFLDRLLPWVRIAFTRSFVLVSAGLMLAALALVATCWGGFLARLPDARAFFSFQNLLCLWVALGAVKVLHELSHALCCKAQGGAIPEAGVLLLVFFPTLYCNVSDSWAIPNKWRRMAVSAAGIWVELLVAALATFLWWAAEPGSLVSNLCLALMVVCTVNTLLLNGNPLMRFDGYHVLADWLEVPNLSETAGQRLQARLLRLLGIAPPPAPRAAVSERFLVGYALASWLYRWVVLFWVLALLHAYLGPRKLGPLATLIGVIAVTGLLAPALLGLARVLHRRGRLPDMKPVRLWVSAGVVVALGTAALAVPLPVRVHGTALIQVEPDQVQKVTVPEPGGLLAEVLVQDGQRVRSGDVLAVLANRELEIRLRLNEADQALRQRQKNTLLAELAGSHAGAGQAAVGLQDIAHELSSLSRQHATLQEQRDRLVLRAPCDGTVQGLVGREAWGKWFDRGAELCRIGDVRSLRAVLLVEPADHELVTPGGRAWVRVHGGGSRQWEAVVTEIAQVDAASIPAQLSSRAGGEVATQQDPVSRTERPARPHYLCAVRLYRGDASIHPGVLGRVKIEAGSQSLWWRLRRSLATTFGGP